MASRQVVVRKSQFQKDGGRVGRKNKFVWSRDSCGLRVSGKDQCQHEIIAAMWRNDNSLTGGLYMYIVFSFQLAV